MAKWIGSNCVLPLSNSMLQKSRRLAAFAQIIRFCIVGVLNNLLGYLIYLALTWLWLEPKLAMTMLYPIGVFTSYFGHSKYSFYNRAHTPRGVCRYIIAHAVGYGTNMLLLYIFVDKFFFPHQLVQAGAMCVLAVILFLLFRYFVFPVERVNNLTPEI
ncbi:conserved membrane hypothetical protein [Syntrophobacter sp. SbD1]|nr:conserved membrane hypothetical protein [Syntrophobacter sp. SbD1]